MVNIIFYTSEKTAASTRLLRIIKTIAPPILIKIHRSYRRIAERFKHPSDCRLIAIFFISRENELDNIIAIRDLLFEIPLIIILPDNNKSSVAKAHSLRPRFLTYIDTDAREVSAVINRIIDKLGRESKYI